ncbi:MAG: TIGR03088 family PEP-CTERM/XrtA system glycosyltransferase [Rhodocyclaceae bacterium]|nr:TIGR03088 family PEP-CTERM/XrtA system glycosyltransferase [Rhodocyclaceae bacterium]
MSNTETARPLVAHVLYNFSIGGLENGVVNLINRMPVDRYRHVIIALHECDPAFCARIQRTDVEFISIRKPPGHGLKVYRQLYALLRRVKPAIVHTRNLAALEMVVPAWAAGVPVRIHGEHGWDSSDPGGESKRYRLMRRLYSPFVTHYIALSAQLLSYLHRSVGIAERRITRICNGVDSQRFSPSTERASLGGIPSGWAEEGAIVFGAVGRLQAVKDQLTLVRAFSLLKQSRDPAARSAKLVIVGDGPLRDAVQAEIAACQLQDQVWLAGAREDVPALMQSMDCFVLPSRAEGISNTLLEAMSCGLPVVATAVGGNSELVVPDVTGYLVESGDPAALAAAMQRVLDDAPLRVRMGAAARARIEAGFSLDAMVNSYTTVYDRMLAAAGKPLAAS